MLHLLEYCESSLDISESHTSVNKAVEEDFIGLKSTSLLKLINEDESFVQVLIVARLLSVVLSVCLDAFDEGTVGEVVWLEARVLHLFEESPGPWHLVSADTAVDESVVGHIIRLTLLGLHEGEDVDSSAVFSLDGASLDHCVETHSVKIPLP